MPVSPARAAAFDILVRVEQKSAYASELLHSMRYGKLSPADHGLATELVMGVLRWRSLLDREIAHFSSQKVAKLDPEVLIALRLAAYQLGFLAGVPQRAAVHESVELVKHARKRSAAPFVNAVLRKLAAAASGTKTRDDNRTTDILGAEAAAELAVASAHPPWVLERWIREFGYHAARQICLHDQHAPGTAIRLVDAAVADELKRGGIEFVPGYLLGSARQVQAGAITRTAAFRDGRITIQDEASQLVALLVGKGSNILDCCAAPGGKTRVLAEHNPDATILAVDLHPHRARLLRKLVPAQNVQVIAADVIDLPVDVGFDRVLADVPCSGTGTFARNPEIKWRLKPEDLVDLQARQLQILRAAMQHVTPGGRLVYSTCSLEREENSLVIDSALAGDNSLRVLHCRVELEQLRSEGELGWKDNESLPIGPYLRTIPGLHPCEGFFAAILQKG